MKWEYEPQRMAFAKALVELGRERSDIVVLGADLCGSTKSIEFGKEFPERFFNIGIAEQNMMGISAGLAASGKVAFPNTFAAFATGRVYDQVRQSICYPNLDVKIIATHAGITVGGDGASHQIIEDIALMRALPNMVVVAPADAPETYRAVKAVADYKGPVYMRLARTSIPVVTKEGAKFKVGKASVLRKGKDVTLVGCGIMVALCLEAAETLSEHGHEATVINMSTIKPLDETTIIRAARETGAMVTAEEHNITAGMGSMISMVLAENAHIPMKRVGIPDVFGESGESDELMAKYGLTVENIVDAAHDVIHRKKKR